MKVRYTDKQDAFGLTEDMGNRPKQNSPGAVFLFFFFFFFFLQVA